MATDKEKLPASLQHIIDEEGYRDKVYVDTEGFLTAGYGHKLTPAELKKYKVGDKIPKAQSEKWLKNDYATAKKGAERFVPKDAPEEVRDIMTNMVYQMGTDGVSKFSKMHAALKKGDWNTAADEMLDSDWNEQTPNRAKRLSDRMRGLTNAPDGGTDVATNMTPEDKKKKDLQGRLNGYIDDLKAEQAGSTFGTPPGQFNAALMDELAKEQTDKANVVRENASNVAQAGLADIDRDVAARAEEEAANQARRDQIGAAENAERIRQGALTYDQEKAEDPDSRDPGIFGRLSRFVESVPEKAAGWGQTQLDKVNSLTTSAEEKAEMERLQDEEWDAMWDDYEGTDEKVDIKDSEGNVVGNYTLSGGISDETLDSQRAKDYDERQEELNSINRGDKEWKRLWGDSGAMMDAIAGTFKDKKKSGSSIASPSVSFSGARGSSGLGGGKTYRDIYG